ncbi:MAG: hypothetical protein ACFCVG_01645 [Kineosporiaceae bacterium]
MVVFLALQVWLPTWGLLDRWFDEGSAPASNRLWAWQMYSSAPRADYTGVAADSRRIPLTTEDLPPVVREATYGDVVPDALCRRHDLTAVLVDVSDQAPRRHPC